MKARAKEYPLVVYDCYCIKKGDKTTKDGSKPFKVALHALPISPREVCHEVCEWFIQRIQLHTYIHICICKNQYCQGKARFNHSFNLSIYIISTYIHTYIYLSYVCLQTFVHTCVHTHIYIHTYIFGLGALQVKERI